jgi:hypothetical protein
MYEQMGITASQMTDITLEHAADERQNIAAAGGQQPATEQQGPN